MVKMRKRIEERAQPKDFDKEFDESMGSGPDKGQWAAIFICIGALILLAILGAWALTNATGRPDLNASVMNQTMNLTCPSCHCDQHNSSLYVIPDRLPDIKSSRTDPECNDYCYYVAQQHACQGWSNMGLKEGKCDCSFLTCQIPMSIYVQP